MLPKGVFGTVPCWRNKKICSDFCVSAVRARPALSRSKAEPAGTCSTGVPRATCKAATHKGHVLGRGETGRASKCISIPFRELNPLWFGHWLIQILFFKSFSNTSFPQQQICSSCTATLGTLCALCATSAVTLGTPDTARSLLRMHLVQLCILNTWHDNMVHFQDTQCFFFSASLELKWNTN